MKRIYTKLYIVMITFIAITPFLALSQGIVTIATNPKNLVNCFGSTGNMLTVVASANNPLAYELVYDWYKDGVEISGYPQKLAVNFIFSNLPLDYKMSGRYMVKIWCVGAGLALNSPALSPVVATPEIDVYVLEAPQLEDNVPSQLASVGDTLTFKANVHSYGYKNGIYPDYSYNIQWFRGKCSFS